MFTLVWFCAAWLDDRWAFPGAWRLHWTTRIQPSLPVAEIDQILWDCSRSWLDESFTYMQACVRGYYILTCLMWSHVHGSAMRGWKGRCHQNNQWPRTVSVNRLQRLYKTIKELKAQVTINTKWTEQLLVLSCHCRNDHFTSLKLIEHQLVIELETAPSTSPHIQLSKL